MAIFLTEDKWNIARGIVKDTSFINKFGAVPAMSQNTTGTIWDINDTTYPWSAFGTGTTLTVDCASASDAGNSETVTIYGLDENWNDVSETVTLATQTGNATTTTFRRVYRAFFTNGADNVGNIDIKAGATVVARITAGLGQTLMAVYTIPAGYTGYIVHGVASCQSGADATGSMFVRFDGQENFRIAHTFEVSGTGGTYDYTFAFPIAIPEMSDIDVRASVRSNNARVTATFDLLLIKND